MTLAVLMSAATMIALQIGDGVSTIIALKQSGLGEGNRHANPLMRRFGALLVTITYKLAAVGLTVLTVLWPAPTWAKLAVLWPMSAIMIWVVWDNFRLVRKNRRYGEPSE